MAVPGRVHDRTLLDALDALDREVFDGNVWRVTRKSWEALRGSSAQGRWTPNHDVEVLYASLERDGALAEVGFRLSLEPVWPSRLKHEIHKIKVRTEQTLRIADVVALQPLGVDIKRYENFDYGVTQAIAAAAHFLEFDGLLVPSARTACSNLVIFLDRIDSGSLELLSTQPVDWTAWRRSSGK
jgi:hypothetical protein